MREAWWRSTRNGTSMRFCCRAPGPPRSTHDCGSWWRAAVGSAINRPSARWYSRAELHFIRTRLIGGQLSKVRRGDLRMGLPVGLLYDPTGNIVLDPDTGVQQAIRHVFTLFARI